MSSRADALHRLEHAIQYGYWRNCSESLYRLIYGTPGAAQLGIATVAMRSYLPVFERRWPDVRWPRTIIENPSAWVAAHDREVPDEPQVTHPADSVFMFGFDAILLAAAYPQLDDVITAASVCAARQGIEACASNAWADADPEAVAISKEMQEASDTPEFGRLVKEFSTRNPAVSSVANAMRSREWPRLLERIKAANFSTYPDPPAERLEADLAVWKEKEMLLILPGRDRVGAGPPTS